MTRACCFVNGKSIFLQPPCACNRSDLRHQKNRHCHMIGKQLTEHHVHRLVRPSSILPLQMLEGCDIPKYDWKQEGKVEYDQGYLFQKNSNLHYSRPSILGKDSRMFSILLCLFANFSFIAIIYRYPYASLHKTANEILTNTACSTY